MRTSDPTDPINALYAEHDEALRHLELLRASGRAIAAEGASAAPFRDFERAVEFLDHEIRAHNEWEEVHLFPKLERFTGPGGPCSVMRAEHRQLWDLYRDLGPLRTSAREGRATAEDLRVLSRVADSIHDLLAAHIAKENQILFPMARRMLSETDVQQMAAQR